MPQLIALDYRDPDAPVAFVESLRATGFGVLRHHPLETALVARIYAEWEAFFASDQTAAYRVDRDTQDGYFSRQDAESAKGQTLQDIKEYFHFYPWGRCPPGLRANLMRYYRASHDLAATLLGWIEQHSPPEVSRRYREPLSHMIEGSEVTLLRILRYPPLSGEEQAVRAAAHEDINLLTILPVSNAPGLQVLGLDGGWIDVPCDAGQVVVNIGDMLAEASGGYFPSTTHRVINPVDEDRSRSRLSLPLFLHPRPDVVLSDRHTAGTYLKERLRELGVA
jgi:isopenicillin N synthase-like dioxygenase